jgi:hypothetical protein
MARAPKPLPKPKKKVVSAVGVPGGIYADDQGNAEYQGFTAQRHTELPGGSYGDISSGGGYLPGGDFVENVPPRYFVGDEYLPASNLTIDQMIELQATLEAGGFYSGDHVVGVWGSADVAAYREALRTPEQEDAFIASYQGLQTQAQTQAYAMSGTDAAGGTVVAPPSVDVAAEAELRKQHPEQIFVSALGTHLKDIAGTIGQPGGGLM